MGRRKKGETVEPIKPIKRVDYSDPANRLNRGKAVYAFCRECMGGSSQDVKECTGIHCQLWPHRRPGIFKNKQPKGE